jgi:glycerol-1-phosphate dehydrogenase [NAD(P)+]
VPLLGRMLASPLFVEIGSGAVANLAALLHERRISNGGRVLVAVGSSQGETIWDRVQPSLPEADLFTVRRASLSTAGDLQAALSAKGYDAVVAIGGGRTLDVTKYAATRAAVPMVAVATNLAHDGLCSPVASLEHPHGKGSYGVAMPLAVMVDLDYVRAAPPRLVRAGIGDVLSNLCALDDWLLAHRERGEPVDGLAASFARTAAEAVRHRQDSIDSEDFLVVLAEALVVSGIAMSVAGTSRPCSGACHEILHAVDELFPGTGEHGELAGLGAAYATFVRGDHDLLDEMVACLRRHGLPCTPGEVGLTRTQFAQAVLAAPATRPDRYTVLEHRSLDAKATEECVHRFVERVAS